MGQAEQLDFHNSKVTELSRRTQGKRSLANREACMIELKKELNSLFKVFFDAIGKASDALLMFSPIIRARTLEASIIQSFYTEALFEVFENKAFFGKYKRLILSVNGYLVMFKKLNSKGYPMNIKTINIQSILNQHRMLDLFADTDYNDDPILYFGYQKNKSGAYVNPQLIYIDNGRVQFSINESDIEFSLPSDIEIKEDYYLEAIPKLKRSPNLKKTE
jgi:hypothetical protein